MNESRYLLLEDEPYGNLLLCSVGGDKEYPRVVHVLNPNSEKSQFLVGRNHDVDVKINDSSASRFHAQIMSTTKGFVLEDNMSKFGTLVLIKGKQEIKRKKGISVQVDKNIITFGVKELSRKKSAAVEHVGLEVTSSFPRKGTAIETYSIPSESPSVDSSINTIKGILDTKEGP